MVTGHGRRTNGGTIRRLGTRKCRNGIMSMSNSTSGGRDRRHFIGATISGFNHLSACMGGTKVTRVGLLGSRARTSVSRVFRIGICSMLFKVRTTTTRFHGRSSNSGVHGVVGTSDVTNRVTFSVLNTCSTSGFTVHNLARTTTGRLNHRRVAIGTCYPNVINASV